MLLKRPKSARRRAFIIFLEVLLFAALYFGLRAWMQREMVSGDPPPLVYEDIQGQRVNLADYRGKPLLLYFWATWCKVCEMERGAITKVARDWPVLTVAMQSGGAATLREYQQDQDIDWRTISDEFGVISKDFGVPAVPAFFVLDGDGKIRFSEMGFTPSGTLRLRLWLVQLLS
ncbi:MAG: redoxin domain-containing protein [Thiotrichales bacterium]